MSEVTPQTLIDDAQALTRKAKATSPPAIYAAFSGAPLRYAGSLLDYERQQHMGYAFALKIASAKAYLPGPRRTGARLTAPSGAV